MLADGQLGELVGGGYAAVESAGAFGGLGGVLGDVGGDPAVGEFPGGGDGPGVVFTSPVQRAGGQPRSGRCFEVDGVRGLGYGRGQQSDGGPDRWGRARPGGTVEADDGVKIDNAAPLILGDLGKGDPQLGCEGLVCQPGLAGKRAAQGDSEAPP